jgi:uncharacterized membrane protein YGL010W
MKSLHDQLANYAAYHRDVRNIATHFVGIPMIVLAVVTLLSRPWVAVGMPGGTGADTLALSPALLCALASTLYYLRLDLRLGLLMGALLAVALQVGHQLAVLPTGPWLAWGLGLFFVGWVFQFVGHYWEGRKPAFVDDLIGLIIGPLFVVTEALFMMGLLKGLQQGIEAQVGPVRRGASPAVSA